jgi:hypothetical protein
METRTAPPPPLKPQRNKTDRIEHFAGRQVRAGLFEQRAKQSSATRDRLNMVQAEPLTSSAVAYFRQRDPRRGKVGRVAE